MSVFRSIVFSAVLAGLVAGLATTAVQMVGTVRLIQQAEVYEKKAEAPAPAASSMPAHAPAPGTSGHDHGQHQIAAAPHDHGDAWEPQAGFQRNAFTAGANVLTAIGFALLLAGIFTLRGRPVAWREGLFWGLGGFAVFVAAPGLGLPPEVPGQPVADLTLRQIWWIGTACATAAGLGLLVFRKEAWAAFLGLGLIALPHVIGAPQPPSSSSDVPATLAHSFVVAAVLTGLMFWALLGVLTSIAHGRFSRS